MHLSISGGLDKMAGRARDFGCETIQVFSRSPQGGKARPLGPQELAGARRILADAGIAPVIVHVPYFANLCAADDGLRAYAIETVAGELERAALLGGSYVVTHLGRPAEGAVEEGLELAETSLREVLFRAGERGERVMLLLENTAGAGREIGSSLEELARLYVRLEADYRGRSGICLDTCHAHAAGYDLSGVDGVAAFTRQALELFGAGAICVVHANDSVGSAGERKDRHAPIGRGVIGEAGFRALLTDPILKKCPFLLETPGSDEERAADLTHLKRLRAGEASPREREGEP